MIALLNADIYTGTDVVFDHAVLIEGNLIEGVVESKDVPADAEKINLGGACVAPGLIDLQVNGGGDVLLNDDPTQSGIASIVEAHRSLGTTDIMPALITANDDLTHRAIKAAREYGTQGSGLVGLHLEGPFLNPEKAGVHDGSLMRRLTLSDAKNLVEACRDLRILLTVAPEVTDADAVEYLISCGFIVSAGHSNATFEQASEGADLGIRMSTHLFNAMSQLGSREPGLVGATLADDRVACGVIVDGHHVHFSSIKAAWHAKPRGKMFLITDAMPPVGGSTDAFRIGEHRISVRNGKALTADGVLGGSVLDMATAVRNSVQKVGIPRDEALRMASTYPADLVGLGDQLGKIDRGYQANLVIFDREIRVQGVVFQGELNLAV